MNISRYFWKEIPREKYNSTRQCTTIFLTSATSWLMKTSSYEVISSIKGSKTEDVSFEMSKVWCLTKMVITLWWDGFSDLEIVTRAASTRWLCYLVTMVSRRDSATWTMFMSSQEWTAIDLRSSSMHCSHSLEWWVTSWVRTTKPVSLTSSQVSSRHETMESTTPVKHCSHTSENLYA